MDDNIKSVLHKVVQLTRQNSEFNTELRKALELAPSAMSISIDEGKLDHIYEYCIEQILKKQANEFYQDFPIKSIIPTLVDDFVRMESFRRKDAFGDFCLALYQQIECVTNRICENNKLNQIAEKMWGQSAYIKTGEGIMPSIENRSDSSYVVARLVFFKDPEKKSQSALQTQSAIDKIRAVVYLLGYKCAMKYSDYENYVEITSLLSDVYQCRNTNHRGNTTSEWEQKTLDRILPFKSFYYFKFLGALAQYVDFVKSGLVKLDEIHSYTSTLETKRVKLEVPKPLYKIELSEEDKNKKRFNRK